MATPEDLPESEKRRAEFATQVHQCRRFAYRHARRRGASHEDADDLAQEVAARLCRWRRSAAPPQGYWLVRLLNQCSQEHRKRFRPLASLSEEPETSAESCEQAPSTDLEGGLARLSSRERVFLELHYHCGISYVEIAQLHRSTPGSVRKVCDRAVQRLRGHFSS